MTEQISDVIVDQIVAVLKAQLQGAVSKDDPAYVTEIQGGLLQANPVSRVNHATVHIGDPDDVGSEWIDEMAKPDDPFIEVGSSFEIGGGFSGGLWWRRGVVKVDCFFLKQDVQYDRDKSRQVANEIRRRVELALGESAGQSFLGLTDDYEQVIAFFPVKSASREAGGPKQHIWHIKVWWQALTSR
jgi:hypothetical protein